VRSRPGLSFGSLAGNPGLLLPRVRSNPETLRSLARCCDGPEANVLTLFHHFIGSREQRRRNDDPQCFHAILPVEEIYKQIIEAARALEIGGVSRAFKELQLSLGENTCRFLKLRRRIQSVFRSTDHEKGKLHG
jgi:hypothetical protein